MDGGLKFQMIFVRQILFIHENYEEDDVHPIYLNLQRNDNSIVKNYANGVLCFKPRSVFRSIDTPPFSKSTGGEGRPKVQHRICTFLPLDFS